MAQERGEVFRTDRLAVRVATPGDADLILALWSDPRVMTYVGFPHGLRMTRERLEEQHLQRAGDEFDRLLVVELLETGEAIGQAKLSRPDEEGAAEPDLKLRPAFWGHGYGSEAWKALAGYEFQHTACQAVVGTPNVENTPSIRMQEAAGAVRVREGRYEFPESVRASTRPVHHYVYRLSRSDWERQSTGI